MKKVLSIFLCIITVILTVSTAFAYDGYDVTNAGAVISLQKEEFAHDAVMINEAVPLTSTYFTIHRKTFAKGASLVKDIKINNRHQEVQIIMKDEENMIAPDTPNVIISELSIRCIRSVRTGDGTYLVRSGDVFTYQGDLQFRLGAVPEIVPFDEYGGYISLVDGESRFVKFASESAKYADISVEFSNHARGKLRVFDGTSGFLYYDDDINPALANLNKNAYVWALNLGNRKLPSVMTLYIYSGPNDYIYQNINGSLQLLNNSMAYDESEGAWRINLTKAINFVISDKPLYSVESLPSEQKKPQYTPEDEEYWINKYNEPDDDFISNKYEPNNSFNTNENNHFVPVPETGGNPYMNNVKNITSIAITAISCITVIAVASASLIFAKKSDKKLINIKRRRK